MDSYTGDLQNDKSEDFLRLISELDATKRQYINEQQRVAELEEQMNALSKLLQLKAKQCNV